MSKEMRLLIDKVANFGKSKLNEGKNVKTVKITVPDYIALKKVTTIPSFKNLSRLNLKIGENIENVNHYQYSEMMRLYPTIGVEIEEIKYDKVLNGFKYNSVKYEVQRAINDGSLSLNDITSNRYFIISFGAGNGHISTSSTTDKGEALEIIKRNKNTASIQKIYVEKPNIDAIVFFRRGSGWDKK